jgi:hypothetical protein
MRSIEKQRQYILYVMYVYALASVRAYLMDSPCVEDVINHLRDIKPRNFVAWKASASENFVYVA